MHSAVLLGRGGIGVLADDNGRNIASAEGLSGEEAHSRHGSHGRAKRS